MIKTYISLAPNLGKCVILQILIKYHCAYLIIKHDQPSIGFMILYKKKKKEKPKNNQSADICLCYLALSAIKTAVLSVLYIIYTQTVTCTSLMQ
jgi:hypothetical protein